MTEIKRPNLASAFKGVTPDRAEGLLGLLPPATPAAIPKTDAESMSANAPSDRPEPPTSGRDGRRKPREAHHEYVGVVNVAAYIEPELLAVVRSAKRNVPIGERERTYDELLVDALNNVESDRLASEFASPTPRLGASPMLPRVRRKRGTEGIQIQLRLDGAQRASLDAIVQDAGAPSRSALVAAALRLHLRGD